MVKSNQITGNNINRGKLVYYKNEPHYIVYQFDKHTLISTNVDLQKVFCVNSNKISVKKK